MDVIPVFIAVTGNYPGRQQLKNYTSVSDTEEGFLAFRDDLERLTRETGPFPKAIVIPSLDHGQPDTDRVLFEDYKDFWGCVMYDCSNFPLAENRKRTARFVKEHGNDYIIEGCVDEIIESGEECLSQLTKPVDAKKFMEETRVDLIVANLGTEHRATKTSLHYNSGLAEEISTIVGHKLVLHGTSSLSESELKNLRKDGIAKVNIWTVLETSVACKILEETIKNVGHILPIELIKQLVEEKQLGSKALNHNKCSQTLRYMTEVYRRDKLKIPVISKIVTKYFVSFGYSCLLLEED